MIVGDERVAVFVGEKCETKFFPPYTCLGIERGGQIIAGAVFNCFTGNDIAVTVAGGPFQLGFIRSVGRYVFEQLGCLRLSITTAHPHVIDIATRLGAQTEGRKRNHFGKGRDATILGILREDWKV